MADINVTFDTPSIDVELTGGFTIDTTARTASSDALTAATTAENNAADALTAATTALTTVTTAVDNFADEYDSTATYEVGEYRLHDGLLYVCNTDIDTAEAWTASHWTQVTVGDEVTDLKSALQENLLDNIEIVKSKNLFDKTKAEIGKYLNPNGTMETYSGRMVSDYLPVVSGKYVVTSYYAPALGTQTKSGYSAITLYDENKNVVAGGNYNSNGFLIGAGVKYVRLTLGTSNQTIWMVEQSDTTAMTSFEEYFDEYTAYTTDFLTRETENFLTPLKEGNKNTTILSNKYGFSFVKTKLRQTVGIPENVYFETARTPVDGCYCYMICGADYYNFTNYGIYLHNNTPTSGNGYRFFTYDILYNQLYNVPAPGLNMAIVAENLSNCSLLAIGDSTVDQGDYMTGNLLSYFNSKEKTITLLGTLGSGDNKNEGRSGWRATDYLTNRVYEGVTNPFYNPTSQTFDFDYYMTNNNFSAPDFVVLQLGINDLYNRADFAVIWDAMSTMIDSILDYNSSIKIILNLPTTPNFDQSKHSVFLPSYQNYVVRYNEYAIDHALSEYSENNVRISMCHLILDPNSDIYDSVHPTRGGYEKMAKEIINQINCWQNGA